MGIDESLTQEIVRRVLSVSKPDRIILFGSAAQGTMTRDSDIDLLVVEPEVKDNRKEWFALNDSLRGLAHPVDIFIMSTERFEESKNVIGGMAFPANKYGRVIYEDVRGSSS